MRDPSLTTVDELKEKLGILPEDTSHDALLKNQILEQSLGIEDWLGWSPKGRQYKVSISFSGKKVPIPNTIKLIDRALAEVDRYRHSLETPDGAAKEERRIQAWWSEAKKHLMENPHCYLISARELVELLSPGWLCCRPMVNWIFTLNEPQIRVEEGKPRLTEPTRRNFRGEIVLVFTRENLSREPRQLIVPGKEPVKGQQMDVLIGWQGKRQRIKYAPGVRKIISPFARKRLYVPEDIQKRADAKIWRDDMRALLCIYLLQEELINLDMDRGVQTFLKSYFSRYAGAKKVGEMVVVEKIRHTYQIPEHYKAFRIYVKRTISGTLADRERLGMSSPLGDRQEMTISRAAYEVGISRSKMYDLVKRGKVNTDKTYKKRVSFQTVPDPEIERLKQSQDQRQKLKMLIDGYAALKGVSEASARRWVQRQEKKGLGLEEIIEQMRDNPNIINALKSKASHT